MRTLALLALVFTTSALANSDPHELLNQEERAWLQSLDRPIIVGSEANYHPYVFFNDNGEVDGLSGDYLRLLAERLGIEFQGKQFNTFAEALIAAENREIDMIPLLIAAPERTSYFEFTQPVFETSDRIFTRLDGPESLTLDDLDGMKVGVVEGYALQAVLEETRPEIDIVASPSEPEGLLALSLGHLDVFISEIGTSSYYIERDAITNLRVAGDVGQVDEQTFGTRNDWPLLNGIIGKGLASITPEEHEAIQRRWIHIGGVDPAELEVLSQRVKAILGIGLGLSLLVTAWIFSLRRLVSRRTSELREELAERRAAEAAKLRLAVAVEQSAEYVLVVDNQVFVEHANRAFLEAVGAAGIIGRPLQALFADDSGIQLDDALAEAQQTGDWGGHILLRSSDNRVLKARFNFAPIYGEGTKVDGYVLTGRDVANDEKIEARLRQGERLSALGTLAGGIAHDFNNLLVPVLGYTELIRKKGGGELEPYLNGIAEAGERARELVQRIAVFGRGGDNVMESLDIKSEIEDSLGFVRHLIPKSISLRSELEPSGVVSGDRTQMQQLLLNLCSNAGDSMSEGGTLTISLEPFAATESDPDGLTDLPHGEYALLTVQDTGIGMSEETKARIFDPYFSEKELEEGTGLGLAIVDGVVARHHGHIYVESVLGEGTRFRVFLPTITGAALPRSTDIGQDDVAHGQGQKILLVDDDSMVLSTVKNMLWGLGYVVDPYSNSAAALRAFQEAPQTYDLVLADLTMPGMTGAQLKDRLRDVRKDVPMGLMTGNEQAARESSLGTPCISKPLRMRELSVFLAALLGETAVPGDKP